MIGVSGFSPSFVMIRLYSLNHMNRNPWFDPCLRAVAIAFVENPKKRELACCISQIPTLSPGTTHPLVNTTKAFISDNVLETLDKRLVQLDTFGLDSFHGGYDYKGFRDSSAQASDEVFAWRQFSILVSQFVLDDRVQTKTNTSLWHTSQ
jgi:hypothetical protein